MAGEPRRVSPVISSLSINAGIAGRPIARNAGEAVVPNAGRGSIRRWGRFMQDKMSD